MGSHTERHCEAELVLDVKARTGESPVWSEDEQALYWIDIEEPALHRFDPRESRDESWEMPSEIGAFALCRSGGVIAALRTGLAKVSLRDAGWSSLCPAPYNPLQRRFNEGKCDARGRFWVGAMYEPLRRPQKRAQTPSARENPLRVFTNEGLKETSPAAVIANGLAWSPMSDKMYFTDSAARIIWVFDYDLESARLSSRRVFAQFDSSQGAPDGAAVDAEGFYWCALYGGGRVIRISPEGRIEREIRLPVSQPTMCAFGGDDYRTLFITTASHGVEQRELHAGGLFYALPGVSGLPAPLFAD
ncbi:MAG: SMP-30/gluconolactonase/LRE family protein [Hyphomicrobiales bacterium]|nr:MAG: SMP-30/gluconolactonase/LRE family protein [Hyphomicrobiales bacterium]